MADLVPENMAWEGTPLFDMRLLLLSEPHHALDSSPAQSLTRAMR